MRQHFFLWGQNSPEMIDASASIIAEHIRAGLAIAFAHFIEKETGQYNIYIHIYGNSNLINTHPDNCPICRCREDAPPPNSDRVCRDTIRSPVAQLSPDVRLQANNVEKCAKLTTLHNTRRVASAKCDKKI